MRHKRRVLPLVLGMCTSPPLSAQTLAAVEAQLTGLAENFISWEAHTRMQLSGVAIYVKAFSSSLPASGVAHALGQRPDMFQRVLAAKGKVVLSGLQPDWHWLAEVYPTSAGSKGYISALQYDVRASHRGAVRASPYEWLPANARRYFTHSSKTIAPGSNARAQSNLTQHVYTVPLSAPQLNAYTGMRLRQGGWTEVQPLAAFNHSKEWRRDYARLFLFSHEHAGTTSLFIQHME